MPNFIYDNTSPGAAKADLNPIGGGDPTKYVQASDWNTWRQALLDLQTVLRGALWYGCAANGSDPAPAGIAAYIWVDSANVAWLKSGGVNYPVSRVDSTDASIVNNTNIAAWGDSLTAGTGSTGINGDFPNKLANLSGYTVYNGGVGGDTSTQIRTRMIADTAKYPWPTIIWAGRNNYSSGATVLADIAAMVAALGHTNYIILSVLNGDFAIEYVGQSGYSQIVAINTSLASTYGAHYIDVRAYLVSQYNAGIPQDVIDHANDIPPSSLRSDTIHLTSAGYALVAAQVFAQIAQLQYDPMRVIAERRLPALFGAPPTIGQKTPATVYINRAFFSLGSQAAPSIAGAGIGNSNTGFYWPGTNTMYFVANGSAIFNLSLNFAALTSRGVHIRGGVAASATVPTLCPDNTATTTGIGAASAGVVSLITAGVERARVNAAGIQMLTTGSPDGSVTGAVGQIYVDSANGVQWQNIDGATAWDPIMIPPRAGTILFDDLIEATSTLRTTGAGTVANAASHSANHPGVLDATVTAAGTDGIRVEWAISSVGNFFLGGGRLVVEGACRIPVLSDATNNIVVRLGILQASSGVVDPGDGVWLEYDLAVNGSHNWFLCSANAGAHTRTSTGILAVANTWTRLRVIDNAGNTSLTGTIDGVAVPTPVTTNLPGAARSVRPMWQVAKQLGAGALVANLDYIDARQVFTSSR